MVTVELKNITFKVDNHKILNNINLTITNQEYLTLVGPTGAGKSSLIAIIAGLFKPTSGQILFDGKDVTHLPANERHCGFMFESYALFPHLSVLDNICYAQHMKTNDHDDTYVLGKALLDLVKLSGRGFAFPNECSGGMMQRVALARALTALEKHGLLMIDEPFKALDAGLRMNLRREVHKIAKNDSLRMTTLHVTNDMEEAMMGDRIIVMDKGKIVQVGTPEDIMYNPLSLFVAEFFSTDMNEFSGKIVNREPVPSEEVYLRTQDPNLCKIEIETTSNYHLYAKVPASVKFGKGEDVLFLIRPQYYKARHGHRTDKPNSLLGTVKSIKFMGAWLRIEVYLKEDQKLVKAEVPTTRVAEHNFESGEEITLYYASEYVLVFPESPQII